MIDIAAARAAANVELVQVQAQVEAARAVLIRLLQDTVEAEGRLGCHRVSQLMEANEQLVVSAMRNQAEAETATLALDDATRSAELDGLTQLPNRWLLLDRFDQAIAKARRHSGRLALLFLDLDHFKRINDSQGHAVGDEVLARVAQRMLAAVRQEDTVSRFGGDEFVILLADIGHVSDAIRVAEKVIAAVGAPTDILGQEDGWAVSIGISFFPDDGDESSVLIDCADHAMYRAKQSGGGRYALHGDVLRLSLLPTESTPVAQDPRLSLLREANEQLVLAALSAQQLQAAAEQAQQRQAAFMAVVAQELRNPLAPIRIAASMLGRNDEDKPLLPRIQQVMDRQLRQVSRLVDDVMDVSMAHAGSLALTLARTDLSELIRAAVFASQGQADSRNQAVFVDLPAAPVWIDADAARLTQLINNLLDNASNYTPGMGEIRVSLSVDGDAAVLTVADTGIGITAEALPNVFEPFAQDSRAIGLHGFHGVGLGLGLTVVRQLAQAHGGSVTALSGSSSGAHDIGSQFVVRLPLRQ